MSEVSPKVSDLLGRLGVNAEVFDRGLGNLSRVPIAALQDLRIAYSKALVESNKFANASADARVNLPPFCYNPAPQAALTQLSSFLAKTYFQTTQTQHASSEHVDRLLSARTKRAAMLQRLINENEHVRGSFEKIAGGVVVTDGRMDGTISMRERAKQEKAAAGSAVSTGAMTGSSSSSSPIVYGGPAAVSPPTSSPSSGPANLNELLAAMDKAVLNAAQAMRPGDGSYQASKGSLGSLVDGPFPTSGNSTNSYGLSDSSSSDSSNSSDDGSSDGSSDSSTGALTTGSPSPQNQLPEANAGQGDSSGSIDVGTLQLQRLVTKRDQMYDLVRTVFDKYNQNANSAIQNLKA